MVKHGLRLLDRGLKMSSEWPEWVDLPLEMWSPQEIIELLTDIGVYDESNICRGA